MYLNEQKALLEKANELIELIEYAQQRIETRKAYTLRKDFNWLYPDIVEKNTRANEITAQAIRRIYRSYQIIINQLQNLNK